MNRSLFVSGSTLLALLVLASVSAQAAEDDWGTVKGQIIFAGEPPARIKINVNKDEDHCLKGGDLYSEAWVINPKNKGVRWAFVALAPEPGTKTLPIHPKLKEVPKTAAVIDQPQCAFIPHCIGIREGQELIIKNSAPVPHNVNLSGNKKNEGFNVLLPSGGQKKTSDLKAYMLPMQINCNIHGWMNGRVAVYDHPYFMVTDADGNFEIKDAPVGNFRLKVWHESIGWRGGAEGRDGEKITIKPGVNDLKQLEVKP